MLEKALQYGDMQSSMKLLSMHKSQAALNLLQHSYTSKLSWMHRHENNLQGGG